MPDTGASKPQKGLKSRGANPKEDKAATQTTTSNEPPKKSRKRTANPASEEARVVEKSKRAKTTKQGKGDVKPSKVDGHPIEVEKDISGDRIEAAPSKAATSKRGKAAVQDKVDVASEQKPSNENDKPLKNKGSRPKRNVKASAARPDVVAPVAEPSASKKSRGKSATGVADDTSIQQAAENLLEAASSNDTLNSTSKKAEASEQPAQKSVAGKGRKRKAEEPTAIPVEANPEADGAPSASISTKKQRNTKSTSMIGNVAASLGEGLTSFLNSMSGAVGAKSIADDLPAVAEDTVQTNLEKEKQPKGRSASKKGKNKADGSAVEAKGDALTTGDALPDDEDEWAPDDATADLIRGFESDVDDDSGDEGFKEGRAIPKPPNKRGLGKQLKDAKASSAAADEPGVIYIGRIPKGFYEHEMRSYFTQFGDIRHVRLSRSKKTGRSKHYAFIEFASAEVAKIVVETMNNYLLFGHILKCSVIPKEQVHPDLWKGADRRFKSVPWARIEGRKLSLPQGRAQWDKRVERERSKREEKAKKLKDVMGYNVDPSPLEGTETVPVKEGKLGKSKPIGAARGKTKSRDIEATFNEEQGEVQEKTIVVSEKGEDGTVVVSEEVKRKKGGKGKKPQVAKGSKILEDTSAEKSLETSAVKQKAEKPKTARKTKATKLAEEQAAPDGADAAEASTVNKIIKKPRSKKANETPKKDTSKPSVEADSATKVKKTSKKANKTAANESTSKAIESIQAAEQAEASKTAEQPVAPAGNEEQSSQKRTPKPSKRALEMAEFTESVKRPGKAKK